MPRGICARGPAFCNPYDVCADWRCYLFPRFGGKPDASRAERRRSRLHYRHAHGLVLARSIFNHSMNYRSVVALGKATLIDDPAEKLQALRAFTEKLIPGRWNDARQPNEKELKATSILRLPLTEVSAKVRTGNVEDDADDYALPVWAGVIPMRLVADPRRAM